MTPTNIADLLRLHEGTRLKPYVDTVGKTTIGVGRNLTDNGITQDECDEMLAHDIAVARTALTIHFTPFQTLDEVRQAVLIDMCFNMGWPTLAGFRKFLAAVASASYETAVAEMLASKWARQVGARALKLAGMMQRGVWY